MIRNAVVHIMNEQPLLADLFALPGANDAGLLCTNIRTMDGHRPVFIDRSESTFFFPYLHIRFLELPSAVDDGMASSRSDGDEWQTDETRGSWAGTGQATDGREPGPGSLLPVPVRAREDDDDRGALDAEIEIDEDFLRRIRDA